ncbi:Hyaluronan synthase [Solidesulfovibrio fructosivorans JJ]]|uniref:Hyaluronan synthase n=1 Tax=Solidesulfovibrio fructosivorans JJ] TaxID=596151 RepID=E1K029_SOLFR|nr:glycosyltransferase [Solidesulfovibrio fructosivorans]EFL50035.1 Hyaluronan synthase [Solidesulfovibrio fructosivorans JJ]]
MKNSLFKRVTVVDWLYGLTLLTTMTAGGTAACAALRDQEYMAAFLESDLLVVYGDLGLALAPVTALLLAWRMWLASRYHAFPPAPDAALPTVRIVIPAYNEGAQVLSTIRSVMASDYPSGKMRVVCVDDGSRDDTWQWMARGAAEFPDRVRLLRLARNGGKRHALLAGLAGADEEAFVTIDSDSEIKPDTLRHLLSPLAASPKVGAVAGNVRVLNLAACGPIPKMLEVSFTLSFDFLRRGQSVYGGVLCTPGALAAYRASVLTPELAAWANQSFLGRPANIGEDRALSNIVLAKGYRVVYQHEAVVFTTLPEKYRGLCRMLLRWARSNVRESLVMARYLFRPLRRGDAGAGWLRLAGTVELVFLPLTEAFKVALVLCFLLSPLAMAQAAVVSCALAAVVPAVVYHRRRPGVFGWQWALCYSFFWLFGLSWISLWGLCSAGCSGWLTRRLPQKGQAGLAALETQREAA